MEKSPAELQDHLGYWLRYVSNQVSHAFARRVEQRGVTVAEWVILRAMYDAGDISPSQLSEVVGMSRGAISKLVDRLCTKQLIARTASCGDRRYQTIALTPTAKRLIPILARLADENDQEFFGHIKIDERRKIVSLLQDLVRKHGWKNVPIE